MSDNNRDEYIKENESIIEGIFKLFKGKTYAYVEDTLKECLTDLKEKSKVH
jgi:hypothetical protein